MARRKGNKRYNARNVRKEIANDKARRRNEELSKLKVGTEGAQDAPIRNHASMYYSNRELAEQVSSFSFNQFMGTADGLEGMDVNSVPTTATYFINPCPGYSDDGAITTGINMDGLKLYTMLSANNAKTTNYAPQDVTTLLLAMGEIITMMTIIKRAMGVAFTYNVRNRDLPLRVISAMGIDPSFVTQGTIATYRMRLNAAINMANGIPFLTNIPYLKKCASMYTTYYCDSESPMAQLVIPMPMSTWIIDEKGSDQGTILKTIGLGIWNATNLSRNSVLAPLDSFIGTLEKMISALYGSTTLNAIYSDILRVFGDNNSFKFELLPENYVVFPEYNPMALLQLHNSTPVGAPLAGPGAEEVTPYNDVYPVVANNALRWNPTWIDSPTNLSKIGELRLLSRPQIIDFPHSMGNPDVDQRVDATRYKVAFELSDDGTVTNATFPDHYVSYVIYCHPKDNVLSAVALTYGIDVKVVSEVILAQLLATKSKFSYDVYSALYETPKKVSDQVGYNLSGDIDFWTFLDYTYLKGVNDLSAAGLYEVRSVTDKE